MTGSSTSGAGGEKTFMSSVWQAASAGKDGPCRGRTGCAVTGHPTNLPRSYRAGPPRRGSTPVLQPAGGVLLGFVPWPRETELPPDVLLLVFLPVLLYWESVTTSLRAIRRDLRGIVLTGTVLVAVTAWAVAAVAHALGLPWGPARVLGAAVAPTDATAVGVVARLLPRRNVTLLRAESLINDGTALVIYSLAVGVTVTAEHLSVPHVGGKLLLSYGGKHRGRSRHGVAGHPTPPSAPSPGRRPPRQPRDHPAALRRLPARRTRRRIRGARRGGVRADHEPGRTEPGPGGRPPPDPGVLGRSRCTCSTAPCSSSSAWRHRRPYVACPPRAWAALSSWWRRSSWRWSSSATRSSSSRCTRSASGTGDRNSANVAWDPAYASSAPSRASGARSLRPLPLRAVHGRLGCALS